MGGDGRLHTHLGQAQVPGVRDVVSRKLVHGTSRGDEQLVRHGGKITVNRNDLSIAWGVQTRQNTAAQRKDGRAQ